MSKRVTKRGWSREFPLLKTGHRYLLDGIPTGLWKLVMAKCKRDGISVRTLLLRMLTAWVAAGLLVGVTSVSAQDLRAPTMVFAAGASADWLTTYKGLSTKLVEEGNPLLRPFGNNPKTTVAAGVAMDVAGVWAWNRYVGRRHPKIAKVGLYAAAAVRVYFSVQSVRIARATATRRGLGTGALR